MSRFVMLGKCPAEALREIGSEYKEKCSKAIVKYGGTIDAIFSLLGNHDLIIISELPTIDSAIQASVLICKLTGITLTTSAAIELEQFNKLIDSETVEKGENKS